MQSTRSLAQKKNLLLAFDAFGTLYKPNTPIPQAYAEAALRHGIRVAAGPGSHPTEGEYRLLKRRFGSAFGNEAVANPNYGKATGLGAEKWWANVITRIFSHYVKPNQQIPEAIISELLTRYSTREGYTMYPDVLPFFNMLRSPSMRRAINPPWQWDKTVVGIITNSDDRVPSILESFGLKVGPRRVGTSAQRSAAVSAEDDINFVVLSYDVGFEKPDRRVFEAAERMLRETLAEEGEGAEEQSLEGWEKLFVGDELRKDVVGAQDAGWHAVCVDREGVLSRNVGHKLRFEPLVRTEMNIKLDEQRGVTRVVDLCSDLGALSRWTPERVITREDERSSGKEALEVPG